MFRSWIFAVVAFLIAGIPGAAFAQVGTPAAAGALRIVDQQWVRIPDGEALSPSGRWLAVRSRAGEARTLCAYDTATLKADRCVPDPRVVMAPDSVVWSPDETRLAFTEWALRMGVESDVWVADFSAGTATDLTDDGVKKLLGAPMGTPLDLAPAWSPDGTELVFARTVETGTDANGDDIVETALYRIPAAGGQPKEVVKVADSRAAVPSGVKWLPSGEILYSVDKRSSDPGDGVWTVTPNSGAPRQIVRTDDVDLTRSIVVVAVAPNDLALYVDLNVGFGLLDLATGQAQRVTLPADGRPTAAALSPDGRRLLIAASKRLFVRDLTTGADQALGDLVQPVGTTDYRAGLTWAANDLVSGVGPGLSCVFAHLAAG